MRSVTLVAPPVEDHERVIVLDTEEALQHLLPLALYRADWVCVKNGRVLKDRLS